MSRSAVLLPFLAVVAVVAAAATSTQPPTVGGADTNATETTSVAAGTYIVIAPQVIRAGLPYAVSVNQLQPIDGQSEFLVKMWINDTHEGSKLEIGSPVLVKVNEPATLSLDASKTAGLDASRSEYTLVIEAIGADSSDRVYWTNSAKIRFDAKSLSLFIQTDKPIYKPGSTVKYRVVVVKPNLGPFDGTVSLTVKDPNGNVIKQTRNRTLQQGVYSDELPLSTEPPLGTWSVVATTDGSQQSSTQVEFSVDKYVLPKFEVTLKTPPFIQVNDSLTVLVQAKYTYGKGVAGKVRLFVRKQQWISEEDAISIERTSALSNSGETTLTLTNDELRKTYQLRSYGGNIHLEATVTEDLSMVERNATVDVSAYDQDVKLELHKQGESFKPGLPYNVVVALKQRDDTPVPATVPRCVQLIVNYNVNEGDTSKSEKMEKWLALDAHGTGVLRLNPSIVHTEIAVDALYGRKDMRENCTGTPADAQRLENRYSTPNLLSSNLYITSSKSPSNSFIQVSADKEDAQPVGSQLSFTVKTTEQTSTLFFEVISRGAVLFTRQTSTQAGTLTQTISFDAAAVMAPKSRLVVYAIRPDNKEILVDATDFKVDGMFRNNVSLSVDHSSCEPGQSVQFKVTAAPGSLVALSAVDQSVLLLGKSPNDVTRDKVEAELERFDTTGSRHHRHNHMPWGARAKRMLIWPPFWGVSGEDASSIFDNAGLLVLTDALLYEKPTPNVRVMYMSARGGGLHIDYIEDESGADVHMLARTGKTSAARVSGASAPVRSNFPETWIFTTIGSGDGGELQYTATAPDTITSWVASAWAINSDQGLGVAPSNAKLTVFRPFFIRLELPYSVKRGEKFGLKVLVFNYLDTEQEVVVNIEHDGTSDSFDIVDRATLSPIAYQTAPATYKTRHVSVPGGGATRVAAFPIVPNKLGQLRLKVTATASQAAGDAVEQFLKVEPEGFRVERNLATVLDLSKSNGANLTRTFQMQFPLDTVSGSQFARFDVMGDLMGSVLSNLDQLLTMPTGCGEQNMITFVPNIVVLRYLKATQRETPDTQAKAMKHIEIGYQRELTYQHPDASFSAFGKNDDSGSTWLTAFVLRSFKQATAFFDGIDSEVLKRSVAWLEAQQNSEGAFTEPGKVIHKDMQGGASEGGVPLTAYVTIALLENGNGASRAVSYLEKQLRTNSTRPYDLALTTYALHLADSPLKDTALTLLETHRNTSTADGTTHWTAAASKDKTSEGNGDYFFQPKPADVETTAYALLTYLLRNDTDKAIPIVRWLSGQRNAYGGFSSTQDTVIALQALGSFAELTHSNGSRVEVDLKQGGKLLHTFTVSADNALVLQGFDIASFNEPIEVQARGSGIAFGQLQYHYYREKKLADAPFYCSINYKETNGATNLGMHTCCNYTRTGASNMAVLMLSSISGYAFDDETTQDILSNRVIQRVDLDKDNTVANIYFNHLNNEPECFQLNSKYAYAVADQKAGIADLRDYYNPAESFKGTHSPRVKRSLLETCPECFVDDEPAVDASVSPAPISRNNATD